MSHSCLSSISINLYKNKGYPNGLISPLLFFFLFDAKPITLDQVSLITCSIGQCGNAPINSCIIGFVKLCINTLKLARSFRFPNGKHVNFHLRMNLCSLDKLGTREHNATLKIIRACIMHDVRWYISVRLVVKIRKKCIFLIY